MTRTAADCQLKGQAGRAFLNECQRELCSVSRAIAAVGKRYVLVEAAPGAAARWDTRPYCP